MKKSIWMVVLLAASLAMTITPANAQKGFHAGVQGNPQLSWLMNQDDTKNSAFKYLTTFNGSAGINMQLGFTEYVGIGLDALYSMQGQRYKLAGIERYRKVDYVKIPVMFVYNYSSTGRIMMIYKIGPQLGILTKAQLEDKDGNSIVSDQKNAYQDMEIGAVASAGIGIKLMNNFFLDVAIRYDYGFSNAEDKDFVTHINDPLHTNGNGNGVSTSRSMTHNSTLGLTVGLRYQFMKKTE